MVSSAIPGNCSAISLFSNCLLPRFALSYVLGRHFPVTQAVEDSTPNKKSRWLWPLGVIATGIAGAAVVAFRGCWHRKMSWPVRAQGHSNQVFVGSGIKRLFDEQDFRSYGPFSYNLADLIEWDRNHRNPPPSGTPVVERHAS